jgi:hypothetical protein
LKVEDAGGELDAITSPWERQSDRLYSVEKLRGSGVLSFFCDASTRAVGRPWLSARYWASVRYCIFLQLRKD